MKSNFIPHTGPELWAMHTAAGRAAVSTLGPVIGWVAEDPADPDTLWAPIVAELYPDDEKGNGYARRLQYVYDRGFAEELHLFASREEAEAARADIERECRKVWDWTHPELEEAA